MDANRLVLSGRFVEEPRFSHEVCGEQFFSGTIEVPRLSGAVDTLPYIAPYRHAARLYPGGEMGIEGQLRAYRRAGERGSRLQLTVLVRKVCGALEGGTNDAEIGGLLLRSPVVRKTPFGREIADLLVTVERAHGKRDCIPCIAWGRAARSFAGLPAGARVRLLGRLQSRAYRKEFPDGTAEDRMTCEVSVGLVRHPI